MKDVIAFINAGGAGARLFPLTLRRAKSAVPIAGGYRLVDFSVSSCLNVGVSRVLVLTQINSIPLIRHVSSAYPIGSTGNKVVEVIPAEQTRSSLNWYQGSADAVRQSWPRIAEFPHNHILVLPGDQVFKIDFNRMLEHHLSEGADITVGTVPASGNETARYGFLGTDGHHHITSYSEVPTGEIQVDLDSNLSPEMESLAGRASMGVYLFKRDVLIEEFHSDPDLHDFAKQIIPNAINRRSVVSYPFNGYWHDVNTIRSYFEANLMLAERRPPFTLYDRAISYNVPKLPPCKIQSSYIADSMISEGCVIINSQISHSMIGPLSFIGNNTTIKNSVILGADFYPWEDRDFRRRGLDAPATPGIEEESYVEGAILDVNVSIGKRCIIKNKDNVQEADLENAYIRDGIVVIPKNARIEDDTII